MKIVSICLQAGYKENGGYHENILTHYLVDGGNNEVTLIAADDNPPKGKAKVLKTCEKIVDNYKLIKTPIKRRRYLLLGKIEDCKHIGTLLEEEKPDFIFMHAMTSYLVKRVGLYLKDHPECVGFIDNHLERTIFPRKLSNALYAIKYRQINNKYLKYWDRYYGVTPGRLAFAQENFACPADNAGVTIMGGDDELIDSVDSDLIIPMLPVGFLEEAKRILSFGGKMDEKKRTIELLKAFTSNKNSGARLILYGKPCGGIVDEFNEIVASDKRIALLEWLGQKEIMSLMKLSDVAIFPGQHSVLWEQALCCGTPCVLGQKNGFDHCYKGGTVYYDQSTGVDGLSEIVNKLIDDDDFYSKLKENAVSTRKSFSAREEALKLIRECNEIRKRKGLL